ncbi:MAG TPA: ABC transporter permease subunit [Bdellovibrionota bacterium]|nr:ABC transporter permease subunit [Bdellovibrionota bacterium]
MSEAKAANGAGAPFFPVVRAIGWVTFLEIVRDKILYNIIVFAFLLMAVGLLASKLTFVRPDRVILDFGMSAVNLCCVLVGIFTGASVLGREFERRTIFVALSRPISRFQFTVGKFAGIALVQICNWALLSVAYLVILAIASMEFKLMMSSSFAWGLILILSEGLLIAGLALMFSTFTTTSLSAMLTIGLFLVGNNVSQIRLVSQRTKNPFASGVLNALSNVLPNLENFHLGFKVTYSLPTTFAYGIGTFLYGCLFAALFVALAGAFIQSRES